MAAPADMSAKPGKAVVQSDAGAYVAWSGADQPAVADERLGCGLLVLKPLGFALPHYADSSKFGYVLEGSAVVGVLPAGNAKERVVRLETGDVIAVRSGDVSWWYNDADAADVTILFMGDTAGAVSPGDISYFLLAGANGVLRGLDAGLLAKAWGVTEEQAAAAFGSQPAALLTKLSHKLHGVCPDEHDRSGLVVNAARVPEDADTEGTGLLKTLTAAHLPALGDLGLSAGLARLEAGAVRAPWVLRDAAAQAVYVARGSGRVQISTTGGAAVLDAEVAAGSLFVVPRFAVACVAAGADGVEWVSLIKSSRPAVEYFAGKGSVLGGITPQIVEAALGVSPELIELLGDK